MHHGNERNQASVLAEGTQSFVDCHARRNLEVPQGAGNPRISQEAEGDGLYAQLQEEWGIRNYGVRLRNPQKIAPSNWRYFIYSSNLFQSFSV